MHDGRIFPLPSATGVVAVLFIVAARTSSWNSTDLWKTGDPIFRVVREANDVGDASGKHKPTFTSSGKKPEFGELDETQDYFPHDQYSDENEMNERETKIPAITVRPENEAPKTDPPKSEPTKTESPKIEPATNEPPTAPGSNKTTNDSVTATCCNDAVGFMMSNASILTLLLINFTVIATRHVFYSV